MRLCQGPPSRHVKLFGGGILTESYLLNTNFREHISPSDYPRVQKDIQTAIITNEEVIDEIEFRDFLDSDTPIYVRSMIRVIAKSGERYLFYCMMDNITEQRIAEQQHQSIVNDIITEKETNAQLQFVNDITHEILSHTKISKALDATVKLLTQHFCSDRAYIVEFDYHNETSSNTYEACADGIESKQKYLQQIPLENSSQWMKTLKNNEMIYLSDVTSMTDGRDEILQMLVHRKIRSIIIAPLMLAGRLIGFFGVDNPKQKLNKCERLMSLSDIIAIVLERRNLQSIAQEDSTSIARLMTDTPGGFCRIQIHPHKSPEIAYVNEGFCNLLNMTKDEVMTAFGQNALLFLHCEDVNYIEGEGQKRIADGNHFRVKCRLLKKDKTSLPVTVFGRFPRLIPENVF